MGLIFPVILILSNYYFVSQVSSVLGYSGSFQATTYAIAIGIVWMWAALYGRSVNKFLSKRGKGNFKMAFGAHGVTESVQILVFTLAISMASMNSYLFWIVIALLSAYLGGNAFRLWLTKLTFDLSYSEAANANKVVFIIETLLWAPITGWYIFMLTISM